MKITHSKIKLLAALNNIVKLERADGTNYYGRCPFCNGGAKTSFMIPPTLDIYQCFNCPARGTVAALLNAKDLPTINQLKIE